MSLDKLIRIIPRYFDGPYIELDNFEANGRYFVRPDFAPYATGRFSGPSGMPAASPHWK